ncbi:MAG: hypothetical protein ACOCXA_03625 [Planctomycetota bacterium]
MTTASIERVGNLRLAGIACAGYPAEPWSLMERVEALLAPQEVTIYGPAQLWFSLPPDGGPDTWSCTIGRAIIGLARPGAELVVEDFADLHALSQSHMAAIDELALSHRALQEEAHRRKVRTRPYWRVALARQRLSDGGLLPQATVSVFLDRG